MEKPNIRTINILMADDDPDDRMLTEKALRKNKLANNLSFVENGQELMDYLLHKGKYNASNAPKPGLILLDLNMPKKDGREALKEIKADPELKRIPIVVLTTSEADEDIVKSYDLGVSSFITKPVTFDSLLEVAQAIGNYWFGIVVLPK